MRKSARISKPVNFFYRLAYIWNLKYFTLGSAAGRDRSSHLIGSIFWLFVDRAYHLPSSSSAKVSFLSFVFVESIGGRDSKTFLDRRLAYANDSRFISIGTRRHMLALASAGVSS